MLFPSPLAQALELRRPPGRALMVAFTGSGGKTTCAEMLSQQAAAAGWRTVLTTTTKMRVPAECLDTLRVADVAKRVAGRAEPLILGRVADDRRKLLGPPVTFLEELAAGPACDLIVVEADGSRGASVKGYRQEEPIVPRGTDRVVILVGVDVVGAARDDATVHRPEILWEFLGLDGEARLGAEDVARAIFEQPGYLDRRHDAPAAILLNKVDDAGALRSARALRQAFAARLPTSGVERLLWRGRAVDGSAAPLWIRGTPHVSGLLLAAGGSRRFGDLKQAALLDGSPLVAHAARGMGDSLLDEVVLVVGHRADEVRLAAAHPRLRAVANPSHEEGMASSIRSGLGAVADDCAGVLVALGDMPRVGPALANAVLRAAHRHPDRIVAPVRQGRRGHPVYFGRPFLADLRRLEGDVGGAAVLRSHPEAIVEIEVDDEGIFADVDRAEDLAALEGIVSA